MQQTKLSTVAARAAYFYLKCEGLEHIFVFERAKKFRIHGRKKECVASYFLYHVRVIYFTNLLAQSANAPVVILLHCSVPSTKLHPNLPLETTTLKFLDYYASKFSVNHLADFPPVEWLVILTPGGDVGPPSELALHD